MLKMLRPMLASVGVTRPDRDRLKAALAARDVAQQVIIESRETLQRLQTVIDQANDAARTASDAARAENDFRREWARSGCAYSGTIELGVLGDRTAEASKAAAHAEAAANVVRKELTRAEEAVRSAQVDLRGREAAVTAAIGLIIAEEASPLLQRFEQIAEEYREMRAQVMGVRQVLAQPSTLANREKMNPAWEGERVIEDALARAKIITWDQERDAAQAHEFVNHGQRGGDAAMLERLTAPWHARAAQLRADPDA